MKSTPEDTPFSYALYRWHETAGLAILALTAIRLWVRSRSAVPPLPGSLARWDRVLALSTYALFYALLILMTVTGFIVTTAYGYPPQLFNLIETPALFGKNEILGQVVSAVHRWSSYAIYALIVLHVAGVIFHLTVTKSGILARMLPGHALDPVSDERV